MLSSAESQKCQSYFNKKQVNKKTTFQKSKKIHHPDTTQGIPTPIPIKNSLKSKTQQIKTQISHSFLRVIRKETVQKHQAGISPA